ncbi:hypothetical protein PoB_007629700 [Plakobranchus ocellatus]|uniref:Uncharacterized protein n=1 Tax=Plakobranchus ocellatus TaxID=259542 RepID=A0AAV4E0H3_9GAST|nr:hypothetical protein PoB_007629700 [Plakobranchus ocellatus]
MKTGDTFTTGIAKTCAAAKANERQMERNDLTYGSSSLDFALANVRRKAFNRITIALTLRPFLDHKQQNVSLFWTEHVGTAYFATP